MEVEVIFAIGFCAAVHAQVIRIERNFRFEFVVQIKSVAPVGFDADLVTKKVGMFSAVIIFRISSTQSFKPAFKSYIF